MTIALSKEKVRTKQEPIAAKEHLFLIAGEMSGDLLGSQLARAIKRFLPQYPLLGVAGPLMCREGVKPIGVFDQLQVMGITDVIKKLPSLAVSFKKVEHHILKTRPKAVIFIDYPGFNLRLARSLRKKGYQGKLITYVCPSVWVWGKGRIKLMTKYLDLLLTLFPFEVDCFSHTDLKVQHVGHPLYERFKSYLYADDWKERFGLSDKPILALFPGSRQSEIELTYPLQLNAAKLFLQEHKGVQICVSESQKKYRPLLEKLAKEASVKVTLIPHHYNYELMRDARAALAKSGTVTLELAWHQTPAVVLYGVTKMGRLLAKYVLRLDIPHYCIVNILQKRTVFPEKIRQGFDAKSVIDALTPLWEEGLPRDLCLKQCEEAWESLKPKGGLTASEQAALQIRELLQ